MLKIYIIEDDKIQRQSIAKIVNEAIYEYNLDMKIALTTDKIKELLHTIDSNYRSVYILDIDLRQEINGIELAEVIRKFDKNGFIIFLSTYGELSEYTCRYKIGVEDFIVKDNFKDTKNSIKNSLLKISRNKCSKDIISININGEDIEFISSNILYLEYIKKKIVMHCYNRQLTFEGRLCELKKILGKDFINIGRRILINRNKVKKINKKEKYLLFDNGEKVYLTFWEYFKEKKYLDNINKKR